MKYVYTGGPYREFRGYVFANGKPVTILDRGMAEAIAKEKDFKLVDEQTVQEVPDAPTPTAPTPPKVLAEQVLGKGKACLVCGKMIPRGWYMHQKFCKG